MKYGILSGFKAFGTKGMAMAENPRESSTVIDGMNGGGSRRLFNSFPQRFETPFEAELAHFVDCMDGELKIIITLIKFISKFSLQSGIALL